MSRIRTLDLDTLADELDDLRTRNEDPDDKLDDDETERLAALEGLENDLGDLHVASRNKGPFIAEDDFEDYADEQAVELGIISREHRNYLDRERWANDLRSDYNCVDFDGTTFYYLD